MSIKVQNYVWQLPLPPMVKLVAIALADHAHEDGSEARPSQALLMAKTGLSKMSIRRAIVFLVENEVIRLDRPASQHRANVYCFILPELRGTIVRPLGQSQRYQSGGQRYQRDTSEGPERSPNHKNRNVNHEGAEEQANDEAIRNLEISLYGHVLSVKERARLMRSKVRGVAFVPDEESALS